MAEITRSTDPKDYQSVPRAIAAMAKSFTTGDTIPPHAHARDQVLYATQGVMRVATAREAWIVKDDARTRTGGLTNRLLAAGDLAAGD